jgi:hypothetical protein
MAGRVDAPDDLRVAPSTEELLLLARLLDHE